ncbi:MAG: hypothetical protein IPO58_04575 [Betaproteobacteria bacterium]|nr:hypothetical protein [Betaproteobacteria bacterium]
MLIKSVLLLTLSALAWAAQAQGGKSTVCTITVNSPEEKDILRKNLPEDKYQFVELVERGRPDWLASACHRGVQCDVLVISGHFDAGTEFYTDRLNQRESLPVEEMERVSCGDSCPGLFSQLKEVYLFGCNTLNGEAGESTAAEIARNLVRSGHPRADAERAAQALNQRYGESNRDAMRRIFTNVPVIYGFSSLAPLGPVAGGLLSRYFQTAPAGEIGSGRASPALLKQFAPSSMIAVSGLRDAEPRAESRGEVCQFLDDRNSPAQKLGSVHRLLGRDMGEARMLFERIEKVTGALNRDARDAPAVTHALGEIARDQATRERYLAFARNTDRPAIRARMIKLANALGWLSPADQRSELARMIGDQLADDTIGFEDVDLTCALNEDRTLDAERQRLALSPAQAGKLANAAVLACLGSPDGHARMLQALTSTDDREVQIAQVYFRHRPITDVNELRVAAQGIAQMPVSDAQVRALDTLALHYVADRESLDQLLRLFPVARSVMVQRAIAGVLIRSDYQAIARPELVRVLRQYRLKSPDGADLIDVLIRRLQLA